MKLILAQLAALLVVATAQNLNGLPDCAKGCVTDSFSTTGCGLDVECICKNTSYLGNLACCLSKACNSADQAQSVDFARQICKTVNVAVPDAVVCSTGSASSVASATASASASASASSRASSVSSSIASLTSSLASSVSSAPVSTSSAQSSSTATSSSSASSSSAAATSTKPNAAAQVSGNSFGFAGAIIAALAFL
ncbi:MAG: hypothetical protein M1829_004771 [Trizodia sp. TS-e1964]|nr:MAG: hypothetical protein M1829_004771 [Trizodia sp. TS-e1964]